MFQAITDLQTLIEKKDREIDLKKKTIDNQLKNQHDLENKCEALSIKLQQLQTNYDHCMTKYNELTSLSTSLQTKQIQINQLLEDVIQKVDVVDQALSDKVAQFETYITLENEREIVYQTFVHEIQTKADRLISSFTTQLKNKRDLLKSGVEKSNLKKFPNYSELIDKSTSELSELTETKLNLESELSQLRAQKEQLIRQADEITSVESSKLTVLNIEIEDFNHKFQDYSNTITQLKFDLTKNQLSLKSLVEQKTDVLSQIQEAESLLATLTEETQKKQQQLSLQEVKLLQLQSTIGECEETSVKLNRLNDILNQVDQEESSLETEEQDLKQELDNRKIEAKNLEEMLKEHTHCLSLAEDSLRSLTLEETTLSHQFTIANAQLGNNTRNLDEKQTQLRSQKVQVELEISTLTQEINGLEASLTSAQGRLCQTKTAFEKLTQDLQAEESKLKESLAKLNQLLDDVDMTKFMFSKMYFDTLEEVESLILMNNELKSNALKLDQSIESLEDQIDEVEENISLQGEEVSELEIQLQEKQVELSSLNIEFQDTCSSLTININKLVKRHQKEQFQHQRLSHNIAAYHESLDEFRCQNFVTKKLLEWVDLKTKSDAVRVSQAIKEEPVSPVSGNKPRTPTRNSQIEVISLSSDTAYNSSPSQSSVSPQLEDEDSDLKLISVRKAIPSKLSQKFGGSASPSPSPIDLLTPSPVSKPVSVRRTRSMTSRARAFNVSLSDFTCSTPIKAKRTQSPSR